MPLSINRPGTPNEFTRYLKLKNEYTIADIEKNIWSRLRHFTSSEIANFLLKNNHFIKNHNKRGAQIKNIKFYIQQAYELYEAAKYCKPNSAALFYYYSFLNLGKGLCEIKYSNFHLKTESKKHGINWKQKKTSNINLKTEKLILSTRGVWHCMLDYLTESNNTLQNPHEIRVKDLLSYCPEISHEYQQSFGEISKLLTLIEPNIMTDNNNNCWIIFSVSKEELISLGLSKNRFLDLISPSNNHYDEVQPDTEKSLKFQTSHSQTIVQPNDIDFYKVLHNDIISLNPSVHLVEKEFQYTIPTQSNLTFKIPQLLVMYSLFFWLSSLIRYDPHSMEYIQRSKYWILVDGIMNESRIWLLELFSWEYYNEQRKLLSGR